MQQWGNGSSSSSRCWWWSRPELYATLFAQRVRVSGRGTYPWMFICRYPLAAGGLRVSNAVANANVAAVADVAVAATQLPAATVARRWMDSRLADRRYCRLFARAKKQQKLQREKKTIYMKHSRLLPYALSNFSPNWQPADCFSSANSSLVLRWLLKRINGLYWLHF